MQHGRAVEPLLVAHREVGSRTRIAEHRSFARGIDDDHDGARDPPSRSDAVDPDRSEVAQEPLADLVGSDLADEAGPPAEVRNRSRGGGA